MRSLLGRFHRPMSRGLVNNMLTMNNLGDGSTLSLDFTAMGGVLDPRLTFSRASTATFVNSQGYVEYAGANIQPYSQDQSQTGTWVRQDLSGVDANVVATTDPNGGNNASKIKSAATLQAHLVYSTISTSISSGLAYTFSVYVKKAELKYFAIHLASTARYTVIFDLDTGVMTATNSTGTPLGTSYSSSSAGNGWWRLSATMITQSTTIYPHLCLSNSGTPSVNASGQPYYTGTLNDGVYTWGAQLNPGSTAQTYYPTTTAAYHAPRFDYSPTNIGEPRGLLVEGQTTNVANNSNALASAGGLTRTYPTGIVSPDGTENAQRFTKSDVTTPRYIYPTTLFTVAASTAYTFSIWFKYDGFAFTTQLQSDSASDWNTGWGASFVIASSGVTTGSRFGACSASTVTPYPNGWYRCTATITTGAAPTGTNPRFLIDVVGTTGVSVLVYGLQLEAGSGASSYIPTGASGVTRNADRCELTSGVSALYDSATGTGTMLTDVSYSSLVSANGGIELGAGTGNQGSTNRISDRVRAIFVGNTSLSVSPISGGQRLKTITAFAPSDLAASRNGNSAVTSSANVTLTGMTALKFYIDVWAGGFLPVYGAVRQVKIWPTRLPNATIQTLSAL